MPLHADTFQLPVNPYDASSRSVNDACAAVFLDGIRREDLRWVQSEQVERRSGLLGDLTALGEVVLRWRAESCDDAVVRLPDDGALVLLVGSEGMCEVVAAAAEHDVAAAVARRLADHFKDPPPPDARLGVRFWTMGSHGPTWRRRRLEAAEWEEVARNYPAPVRAQLAPLMDLREPAGGSLVLWHGPPGCGKTHALRALAAAWQPWASTHYVTDPESLLKGTDYLMEVATAQARDPRWRLVVLEDAGELMAADARTEIGQGLSRLLNLSDGLLGQGVNCLLLVTTNEPIGRLHPAVRRPGRCLSTIAFGAFGADEANAWLALEESDAEVTKATTLAELFALRDGRDEEVLGGSASEAYGFARALTA